MLATINSTRERLPLSSASVSSDRYVVDHITVLMWPSWLCGVGLNAPGFAGPDSDRTPHNLSRHSVRRKFISPSSSFHGLPLELLATSQLANALALSSRSTSAYTFVVARDTCPSQARIVLMSTPERSRCVAVV